MAVFQSLPEWIAKQVAIAKANGIDRHDARLALDFADLLVGPTSADNARWLAASLLNQGGYAVARAMLRASMRFQQATQGPVAIRMCRVVFHGPGKRRSRFTATHLTTRKRATVLCDDALDERQNAIAAATKLFGHAPHFIASESGGGYLMGCDPACTEESGDSNG